MRFRPLAQQQKVVLGVSRRWHLHLLSGLGSTAYDSTLEELVVVQLCVFTVYQRDRRVTGSCRRDWCPGPELNRHAPFGARDFKSRASASFATRAGLAIHCHTAIPDQPSSVNL